MTRAVVHVPDVSMDPEYTLPAATTIGYRSVLAVPMMHEGVARGTILVARDVVAPFSGTHLTLIQTFAAQGVIAIENVRLFNETKEALEQQTATADILRVIASSPTDLQPRDGHELLAREGPRGAGWSRAMTRVLIMALLALTLLAAPLAAEAQQSGKVYRVGWMTTGPLAFIANFREGMRELGYVEGQNVVIEQRYGAPEKLTELAEELARLKADLIVASGSAAVRAAQKVSVSVPIVFVTGDPVGHRAVVNLARPGGNMTGLALLNPEVSAKWIELISPQGNETCRPPSATADEVRAGHQPEDREGARPHDPARGAGPGGRGDRVTPRVVRLTQPSFPEIGMRPRLESASLSGLTERGLGHKRG
jgi:ABC transporter substrate binding protein/GAF domain